MNCKGYRVKAETQPIRSHAREQMIKLILMMIKERTVQHGTH